MVIRRADGSGTYVFTGYLAMVNAGLKSKIGSGSTVNRNLLTLVVKAMMVLQPLFNVYLVQSAMLNMPMPNKIISPTLS